MILWRLYKQKLDAQIERDRLEASARGRARGLAKIAAKSVGRGITEDEARSIAEGITRGITEGEAQNIHDGVVRGIAEGIARGLVEGKAKGAATIHQLWSAWNNRRIEAEGKNIPFNEPPPPPPLR